MEIRRARFRKPAEVEVPDGEVRIIESYHADDFEMPMGTWTFHKLAWVAMGRGELRGLSVTQTIQRGDFLIIPAGMAHRFVDHPGDPLTLVIFCVSPSWLAEAGREELQKLWDQRLMPRAKTQPQCGKTAFHEHRLVELFRQAVRERSRQEVGWQAALTATAIQVILAFARGAIEARETHNPSSHATVAGVVEHVETYPYKSFRIAELAEECALSTRRFGDVFKQITGYSFVHYLNRCRIESAKRKLQETGHILYACHESGFNDLAYFYRVFKRETGQTPGQFIQR